MTATEAPAGTETLAVQWFRVAVPDVGIMVAAVARPSGAGPFPVVLVLHGTHGFARQYVQLAQDLARAGFLAVAGCWFSGSENPNRVAPRDARGERSDRRAIGREIMACLWGKAPVDELARERTLVQPTSGASLHPASPNW